MGFNLPLPGSRNLWIEPFPPKFSPKRNQRLEAKKGKTQSMKMPTPLDPKVFNDLCGKGSNGDLVKNIGGVFISKVPLKIHSIRIAAGAKDYKKVSTIANQMKSCSSHIGATGFSNLCCKLEEFSSWEETNALFELINSIEKEFVRVRLALESEMKQLVH